MRYPRVQNATAINDHTLLIEFDDKSKKLYDISPLLEREMFRPLKDVTFFKAVKVDTGGYAVYWNADIDLSEYELWTHGETVNN